MSISRKIAVGAAATGLVASALAFTGSQATADTQAVTVSIQGYSDDTNLDEYYGTEVLTRDPRFRFQEWEVQQHGDGTYTIKGKHFGKCLTAVARGQKVTQKPCDPGNLAQRWILDLRADTTEIESRKFRGWALQAHGMDTAVTLEAKGVGRMSQQWGLYQK